MLTCREVTKLVSTEELRDAPLRTRLSVRMHLAMCRHCRRYQRELKAIGDGVRRNAGALLGTVSAYSDRVRRIHAAVAREIRRGVADG